jgi:hypothetical protein
MTLMSSARAIVRNQDHELVAADPGDGVHLAHEPLQPRRHGLQETRPRRCAPGCRLTNLNRSEIEVDDR